MKNKIKCSCENKQKGAAHEVTCNLNIAAFTPAQIERANGNTWNK